MLQISHISKQYKTGDLVQQALDDVSLNLRDNEFVAILGPSGSGKTTLLNIIGGLDRYDTGDLIINGISTKKYRDRDWDSYRNHTIGFVFQSYNLIPHQTVLANVELALTISGISGEERRRRAEEALEKVGLGDQMHKKPSQMSGGQMQRVAIARALVNDPDILLADEPTGALDTDTSIQVMDLLKEVASDRLVVMVTHNPELAEKYATRIVRLRDGRIQSDSMPYEVIEAAPAVHKNMGKSSMSFLTALQLSFNNLRTKKARTILVSFAGSIGIIGIALILSLSNGVNNYINDVEEETLSVYPVEIDSSSYSMNMTSQRDALTTEDDGKVHEVEMITSMLSNVSSNDLESLKDYIDSGDSGIEEYANAIEYDYDITPRIYRKNEDGTVRQVNPDTTFSSLGFGMSSNSLMSSMTSTSQFYSLPEKASLYEDQYDLEAGHWPQNSHEMVLVLTSNGSVSDFLLYVLGMKDADELDEMVEAFSNNQSAEIAEDSSATYDYDDFLGITFQMINVSDLYTYDEEYQVWVDQSQDADYVKSLVENGTDLTITGVVKQKSSTNAGMLNTGIYYSYDLNQEIMDAAADSQIVKEQLANTQINVFTGKAFGDTEDTDIDFSKLISVDENALANAFSLDTSALSDIDFSQYLNTSSLSNVLSSSSIDTNQLMSEIKINVTEDMLTKLFNSLMDGYQTYEKEHPDTSLTSMLSSLEAYIATDEAKALLQKELQELIKQHVSVSIDSDMVRQIVTAVLQDYQSSGAADIESYLNSDAGQKMIADTTASLIDQTEITSISTEEIQTILMDLYNGYAAYAANGEGTSVDAVIQGFTDYLSSDSAQSVITSTAMSMIDTSAVEADLSSQMASVMSTLTTAITNGVTNGMTAAMSQLANSFSINADAIANAFTFHADAEQLSQLLSAMMSSSASSESLSSNLSTLNYAEEDSPSSILIYPKDFDAKQSILDILDNYSQHMKDTGQEDKAITYTDMVGTLMSSVTTIVNAISYVLIAFVAISLIVSSIMIGVITFISVLERKKEIGILRAIGASKHNVSSVFNAETFIIGLLAGLFGIGITLALLPPVNALIYNATGRPVQGSLPLHSALVLIMLSIILTLIGGFIPAKKAAKSDPVEALRSE